MLLTQLGQELLHKQFRYSGRLSRGSDERTLLMTFDMERKPMMGKATRAGGAARLMKNENHVMMISEIIGKTTYVIQYPGLNGRGSRRAQRRTRVW